jgi:hypothetical protein
MQILLTIFNLDSNNFTLQRTTPASQLQEFQQPRAMNIIPLIEQVFFINTSNSSKAKLQSGHLH